MYKGPSSELDIVSVVLEWSVLGALESLPALLSPPVQRCEMSKNCHVQYARAHVSIGRTAGCAGPVGVGAPIRSECVHT